MIINNYQFFLGGYDAEMCEIIKILKSKNIAYFDNRLSWGARLSDYKVELERIDNKIPVLVELILDIEYPENCIIIDHHGEKASKQTPTSIEQVAKLLNINLSRWQKLIAANDRGWIDGLIEAGASETEIKEIRAFDRKCQGVTQEMEDAADKIFDQIKYDVKLIVIEFPFNKVSPVMDRLYGKTENILVKGPSSINFSGNGSIVLELSRLFPEGYFGGNLPQYGFWGKTQRDDNIITLIKNLCNQ